jgi:hypothetical protein
MSTKSSLPGLGLEQRRVVGVDARVGPGGGSGGASVGGDVGDRNDLDVGALPVSGGVPLVHDESVADYGSAQLLH